MSRHCVRQFFFTDMNLGVRKISQPTSVIRVAVRENNVSQLIWLQSEVLNLPDCGIRFIELKPGKINQLLSKTINRVLDIEHSDTSID